jgi:hypothetical protein
LRISFRLNSTLEKARIIAKTEHGRRRKDRRTPTENS